MNDRLQALSDQGVSVWLDDISRGRLKSGNLAELIESTHVVGVTSNPTIFAKAVADADDYADQVDDLAVRGVSLEEAVRAITTYDVRWGCDVLRDVYDADRRPGRPGQHRGRPPARARHACHDRGGPRPVVARRPAQRDDQDPGDQGGPVGHHRRHVGGHQRQRDPHLQPRALPPGDGRLPDRARAGQGQRRRPLDDPLGGVVLRQPDRHRGRQASRRDRRRRGQGSCAARPPSPTRGSPTRPTRRSSAPTAGRRSRTPARTGSARCGRRRRSRTPTSPTRCTSPTWSPLTPSTRCRRPRSRRSPTTARSPPTPSPATTPTPRTSSTALEKLGISYDDVVQVVEDEGVDKFEKSWQELLDTVSAALEKARQVMRPLVVSSRAARRPAGHARRGPGSEQAGRQGPHPMGAGRRVRGVDPARAGSTCRRRRGLCWPRSTPCARSCGPRASTGWCCAGWAARRWHRR